MSLRAKDPDRTSRFLRAAAISALFAGFVGALALFDAGPRPADWNDRLVFAMTLQMATFWMFFIPLYVATVHKSTRTLEFEEQARLAERKRVRETNLALKSCRKKMAS